jgi:CMP-N,N'-diacetyllegionaminic acid synthase
MTIDDAVLAVIIGRAGSKGLPGKNVANINGKPIVAYSIDHALDAETVGRVIVSTDSPELAATARAEAVEVIDRPAKLATDTATVDSAVRHAITEDGGEESIIVILYANVPIRPDGLIDRAVRMLIETGADSVQSYCDVGKHHPYWMVSLDVAGRVLPHHPNPIYRRQDLPRLLLPDGGVIAVTRESLFTVVEGEPHAFLGTDRRGIETAPGEVVDVDNALDLSLAQAMLLHQHDKQEAQR